jgi:tripeptidyl-peptidase-1
VLHDRLFVPQGWSQVARANAHHPVVFTVALRQQNLQLLEERFWQVADPKSDQWQQFLDREDIDAMIAPLSQHVDAVMHWLGGLRGARLLPAGDHIKVRTSAEEVEQLFQTEVFLFSHNNGHLVARTMGEHSVPNSVAQAIDFVSGLTEFPMPRSPSSKVPQPNSTSTQNSVTTLVSPQTLFAMYDVPAAAVAQVSQGVAEFQGDRSYNKQDLATFFDQTNLAAQTVQHIVGPYDGTDPDGEATLDVQYIMGVGQGAENWYWTSNGWMYDWATDFFNATNVPDAVSISWGWAEDAQCPDTDPTACSTLGVDSAKYVARVNTEFQKIGLRGVSLLAASGDSGANGRSDSDCSGSVLHASFPASSPFVTAVGATMLSDTVYDLSSPPPACSALPDSKCASGGIEVAVSWQEAGFTSGGGFSTYTAMPSYQTAVVRSYLESGTELPPSTYFNRSNRAYPDIAAMGNNFLVYMDGWSPVGGTSASSPTVAGVMSYLNAASYKASGKPLGFLNPFLYQMFAEEPSAFTDVVSGDNKCTESTCTSRCKGYLCAKGWDPVTGLGTPVVSKMLAYLEKQLETRAVLV